MQAHDCHHHHHQCRFFLVCLIATQAMGKERLARKRDRKRGTSIREEEEEEDVKERGNDNVPKAARQKVER
ncbi:hypothetical protein IWX91DRAFT_67305 [Phyllosticta citricarpa]